MLTKWGNTDIYRLDEDICSRGVYQTYPPSCSEHLLSGMKCSSVAVLSSVYSLSCTRLVMFGGFTISAALNPRFPGRLAPGELPFPGVWHSEQVHWRGWSLRWWAYMCRSMQLLTIPQKQHLIWLAEKHEHIFERNLKVLWNYKSLNCLVRQAQKLAMLHCPSNKDVYSNKEQVGHQAVPGGSSWRAQP